MLLRLGCAGAEACPSFPKQLQELQPCCWSRSGSPRWFLFPLKTCVGKNPRGVRFLSALISAAALFTGQVTCRRSVGKRRLKRGRPCSGSRRRMGRPRLDPPPFACPGRDPAGTGEHPRPSPGHATRPAASASPAAWLLAGPCPQPPAPAPSRGRSAGPARPGGAAGRGQAALRAAAAAAPDGREGRRGRGKRRSRCEERSRGRNFSAGSAGEGRVLGAPRPRTGKAGGGRAAGCQPPAGSCRVSARLW